jgi:hypothetical protein
MMFNRAADEAEWVCGSARVDGSMESDAPAWVLQARKGRLWVDLASGPMRLRCVAVSMAVLMNGVGAGQWDAFLRHDLPVLLAGRPLNGQTLTPAMLKDPPDYQPSPGEDRGYQRITMTGDLKFWVWNDRGERSLWVDVTVQGPVEQARSLMRMVAGEGRSDNLSRVS